VNRGETENVESLESRMRDFWVEMIAMTFVEGTSEKKSINLSRRRLCELLRDRTIPKRQSGVKGGPDLVRHRLSGIILETIRFHLLKC
jgi:hypothetical protein